MISRKQLDEGHRALDAATLALEDALTARLTRNFEQQEGALESMVKELGAAKEALRGVQPDD